MHVINGSKEVPWSLSEKMVRLACCLIVRGPGNSRVEWIRVYTPGTWQPVAESTLGPAPDHASTDREWRRVYHFDLHWPRDSTGGTTHCGCPRTAGLLRVLLHVAIARLAHTRIPTPWQPTPKHWIARSHVRWIVILVGIFGFRWWLTFAFSSSGL